MKNLLRILCIFFTTPALCLTCDMVNENYPVTASYTTLPNQCQELLKTYVNTKNNQPRTGICNNNVISCTENQKTSQCNPCALSNEWNTTFFNTVSQKYEQLCKNNDSPSEDDLVNICSDVFGINNPGSAQNSSRETITVERLQQRNVTLDTGIKPANLNEYNCNKQGYDWIDGECITPEEEEIDMTPSNCRYSGGDWDFNKERCTCDKEKGLKQSTDKKTCQCKNAQNYYSSKTEKCEQKNNDLDTKIDTKQKEQFCTETGGTWQNSKCTCDKDKGLKINKETGTCKCTKSGTVFKESEGKCIEPIITKKEYEKIESELEKIISNITKQIESECKKNKKLSEPCKKKDETIKQLNKQKKETLDALKQKYIDSQK